MKNIYVVYKAINVINGKCYIGIDSDWYQSFNRRYEHEWCSYQQNNPAYNFLIHKAIRKYGKENFIWEVIYETFDIEVVKYMEKYFILECNSKCPNGYNLTNGGDGINGYKHTKEFLEKHSLMFSGVNNPMYGRKRTKEWTDNHSKTLKSGFINGKYDSWLEKLKNKTGENHHLYGKKRPEHALKLSKKYIVIDPYGNSQEVIGLKDFCKNNNLCYGGIMRVARGMQNNYKGWKCLKT